MEKKKREQDLLAQLYNKENFVRFRQPKTCIQFSCVVIKVNSAVLKMHSCTVSVRRPVQQPFDWPLGPKFFFPKPKCKSPAKGERPNGANRLGERRFGCSGRSPGPNEGQRASATGRSRAGGRRARRPSGSAWRSSVCGAAAELLEQALQHVQRRVA